ncbi:uncharacterized protein [Littorina saxatilis]|uniref:uncharacterized protein n=1 Tax=Littorina saxatilis TaxID=31220 RepID=UPI0038B51399
MELASEIRDEFLTCNICLEGYKQPKQLPCLHTFCRDCLSRYIAQTVGQSGVLSVPCPLCRRVAVPRDPDPRTICEWADQFPDNFFVASLRETVEARKKSQSRGDDDEQDPNTSTNSTSSTTYFMGEATSCSKHLTHRMTHYCLTQKTGVCELCLSDPQHQACPPTSHIDSEAARLNATKLMNDFRQQMEDVKKDVEDVKRTFSRKPRRVHIRKEEVEIAVGEYFSDLRARCAKFLLAKEREMIDNLTKVTEDETQRAGSSQKECDAILTSVNNTMTLFDTLTRSGPFNAMHVLATAEEQISNFSRLAGKLDQEAQADTLTFQPPERSLEDHISALDLGSVVADLGRGEMPVTGDAQGVESESGDNPVRRRESRLSELRLSDVTSAPPPAEDPGRGEGHFPDVVSDFERSESLPDRGLNVRDNYLGGNTDDNLKRAEGISSTVEAQWRLISDWSNWEPTAPPLDYAAPPPYSGQGGGTHYTGPSAPPITDHEPAYDAEDYSGHDPCTEAYNRARRKDMTCKPVAVFSGNMRTEPRRGGLCGAATMKQVNRAAFVDRHNHSLKIVDFHQSQIVGYLHLGNLEPWDVTFMKTTEDLAVTCPGARCLVFIPTGRPRLEISSHVITSVGYSCIAHLKDKEFAVGVCAPFGNADVRVINLNGDILRRILKPQHFRYPRTICADESGDLIVVSDWTSNAVVIATSAGALLICYYLSCVCVCIIKTNLSQVTEDETQRAGSSQKECDAILTSVNNTMTLFDTLTRSGPFNAMHVLATAEEQISNFSKLAGKLDQEAQADTLTFQPPERSLEDHISALDLGSVVADLGRGEMPVTGDAQGVESESGDNPVRRRESRLSELRLSDVTSAPPPAEDPGRGEGHFPDVVSDFERSESLPDRGLNVRDNYLGGNTDDNLKRAEGISSTVEAQWRLISDWSNWEPTAPPLDYAAPPPYSGQGGGTHYTGPSAPPITDHEPAYDAEDYSGHDPCTEAYNRARRKDMTCKPVAVFSGNMRTEPRRGGLCGAATMKQVNRAAFVDRHNHSLKIVDFHQSQIVGYLHLGNLEPWDVTFMKTTEDLAVTCPGARCLVFIPTGRPRLEISSHVITSVGYSCIAHLKDKEFAVGVCAPFGNADVRVINLNGDILRRILKPQHFRYPRTICADESGDLIVVSDWTSNAVVIATSAGELVCRYKEAPGPKGVAISKESGILHVLDGKWSRLHLVDVTGRCLGICKIEGCREPRMVVVVPTQSVYLPGAELVVVSDGNNALHVLSLSGGGQSSGSAGYNPVSAV